MYGKRAPTIASLHDRQHTELAGITANASDAANAVAGAWDRESPAESGSVVPW
jgi:hypothetical protein